MTTNEIVLRLDGHSFWPLTLHSPQGIEFVREWQERCEQFPPILAIYVRVLLAHLFLILVNVGWTLV